jgi:Sulfatase
MKHASTAKRCITLLLFPAVLIGLPGSAWDQKKPNILVVWGDDVGYWNISAYNQGMMGYKTPNIDRIAKEGALFTDWYGQQSEWAYDRTSHIGKLDKGLDEASARGWTVVDMRKDWKIVFPFEQK